MHKTLEEQIVGVEHCIARLNRARRCFLTLAKANGCSVAATYLWARTKGDDTSMHRLRVEGVDHSLQLTASRADLGVLNQVLLNQGYRLPEPLADLEKRINGKTIVDLGANIGLSAVYFASRYCRSRVVAVEPHARNADFLTLNAQPYNGQIEAVRAAVTTGGPGVLANPSVEFSGFHASYQFDTCSEGSLLTNSVVDGLTPEQLMDLQDIDPRDVGLVKMDIEGAERNLCANGYMDEMLANADVFAVETHDRIVQGAATAVEAAAGRAKLSLVSVRSEHDLMYARI